MNTAGTLRAERVTPAREYEQLAHMASGWMLELQAMCLFGSLAVMLLGAGRFSAGGALGR